MALKPTLPRGQYEIQDFPRFGLTPFASRFPAETRRIRIRIAGDVARPLTVEDEIQRLERIEQISDFHCVTTWTRRELKWSGFRFSDFYRNLVVPLADAPPKAAFVVIHSQDGYRTSLPLTDLMADSVLLADKLDDEPLTISHGAPLRIVAPAHYGYKSVKHVNRVDFLLSDKDYRQPGPSFMMHPRARVMKEERGRWIAGWILRYLYRPLVRPTARRFEVEIEKYIRQKSPVKTSDHANT